MPLRALKIVRGGRFVLGQTALNHVYFEIDRRSKTIGFARCVLRVGTTCFGLCCCGCWLCQVRAYCVLGRVLACGVVAVVGMMRACVWTCVCLVSAWLVLWRLD